MTNRSVQLFQKNILRWYKQNARAMPWRETRDPYKIWVSEIMLQQTQVDTVIKYYNRWVRLFPTIEKLARADREKVFEAWAGLGYYRRARMLHEAAVKVLREHDGVLPSDISTLKKLPGIGRYTAGAIASIAFGKQEPVLDGNVIRVLSRVCAVTEDVTLGTTQEKLWKTAGELVSKNNPGDHNQAMMELGATLCLPTTPLCASCPIISMCKAASSGRPEKYPVRKPREKVEKVESFALVLQKKDKIFLRRQPEKERWGGLWMLPYWQDREEMLQAYNFSESDIKPFTVIEHGFTKYRVKLNVFTRAMPDSPLKVRENSTAYTTDSERWIPLGKIGDYAMPAPHQRVIKKVLQV